MDMKYKFPEGFKWGSAVWAQGTEGAYDRDGKAPTVWDEYYRLSPTRMYNGVGPSDTLNWYDDYHKYADLAKEIGHTSFRTSILWARLMPDGKNVNQKAVEFYRNMFKAFKDNGMELTIVLYWFDMPLMYESKGGFTNREIIPDFVNYCNTCFDLFDGLVDVWYVYNEPIVDVLFKYINNMCYPNKLDFNLAMNAVYNMVVAQAKVVETFKQKNYKGKVGTVLNRGAIYPRSQHPADIEAKELCELLECECYEEPMLNGQVKPEWFEFMKEHGVTLDIQNGDQELIKNNTIKVVGLNMYMPTRVKAKEHAINPKAPLTFDSFYDVYDMHGSEINKDRGWEIYPMTVYDALMIMKNKYGNPEMYITENGMGVQDEYRFRDNKGTIQDDYRIDYVQRHLQCAHDAIQDGANLLGYNMWSFIDLWSPSNQFKNCYGFYEYDLQTGQSRKKKSADWFKKVSEDNGFDV